MKAELEKSNYKKFSIEALSIGITPSGRKRWLETRVKIFYIDGTVDIEDLETEKEAYTFLYKKILPKPKQGEFDL